jgi:plastocyanin
MARFSSRWTKYGVIGLLGVGLAGLVTGGIPEASAATRTYQVVTNEIAAKQKDGSTIEVYRFDPAVYVAGQGDDVVIKIRGLKGQDHPVELEGYGIQGVVHRNQVTTIKLKAHKAGFFRLICTAHADAAHEGPMEAYLVVTPK